MEGVNQRQTREVKVKQRPLPPFAAALFFHLESRIYNWAVRQSSLMRGATNNANPTTSEQIPKGGILIGVVFICFA